MDPTQLLNPVQEALADGRVTGLVAGTVLLLFGARVYRVLVVGPGIIAGLVVAGEVNGFLHLGGWAAAALAVGLALAGALLFAAVERWTLAIVGAALAAGLFGQGWTFLHGGSPPWWSWLVAGSVGALVIPRLYRVLLRPLTALAGALTLTATMAESKALEGLLVKGGKGALATVAAVIALAAAGTAFQWWLDRGGGTNSDPPPRKKGKEKGKRSSSA